MSYVSLHNHTHIGSPLDGFSSPEEIFDRAKEIGLKGIAITDHGSVMGLPYVCKVAKKYPEIKLIYGCEIYEWGINENFKYHHLVILCRNEDARVQLNEILTKSNLEENFYYKPRTKIEWFRGIGHNFVVTSACMASKLKKVDFPTAVTMIEEYKEIFPYFYLEIQSARSKDQNEFNIKILELAKATNTKIVVTTDSHFAREEDLEAQNTLVKIGRGSTKSHENQDTLNEIYDDCFLQSESEIFDRIGHLGKDLVQLALDNTLEVLGLCEDVTTPVQDPRLPTFEIPEGFKDVDHYCRKLIVQGAERLGINIKSEPYKSRLKEEFGVISKLGFTSYFLIAQDIVKSALDEGYFVGKGRGSAGGCLVAFLLGITELDPIKYDLIFSRFLNEERISFPDIDMDFHDREPIMKNLNSRYGEERVCKVMNLSFITPKVAVSDVCKLLGIDFKESKKISDMFNDKKFDKCIENAGSELDEYREKYPKLFELAGKVSGRMRGKSVHAGAVVIADTTFAEYMPIERNDGENVIQADKRIVEDELGLVKFDVLGVATLKVVQDTLEMLGKDISYVDIKNDDFLKDKKTYDYIATGNTNFIFQISSAGMQGLCKKIKPTSISCLSDILALYRPDSMQFIDPYIENKFEKDGVYEYVHPDMGECLDSSFGVMIFQESMMHIVRKFGGRSYGGADIFRKIIGKKLVELVRPEVEKLKQEIIDNGYSEDVAETIASTLRDAGNYSFNKSHSVGYAVLTYVTAFLKANHPVEFMCANLINAQNATTDKAKKLAEVLQECEAMGIEVVAPKVNVSGLNPTVRKGKIYYGLLSLKGTTSKHLENIINAYPLKNSDQLIDMKVDTKTMVTLIKSGYFGSNKEDVMRKYFEKTFSPIKKANKRHKEKYNISDKCDDLTKVVNDIKHREHMNLNMQKYCNTPVWMWEMEAMNSFVSGSPIEKMRKYIIDHNELEEKQKITTLGIITSMKKMVDKKKRKMCFCDIESPYGHISLLVFAHVYQDVSEILEVGRGIVIIGKKSERNIIVDSVTKLDKWLNDRNIKM